jgi:diguanylate cyclase (GGDEF)-like protein
MSTPPAPPHRLPPAPAIDVADATAAAEQALKPTEIFRGLLQAIAGIAGATHLSFLLLFLWSHVGLLAAVNVGSVLCYVAVFYLARSGRVLQAWALTVFEVLGHAVLATFVIGWDTSFHYSILLVIPVAVVSPIRPLALKALSVCAVAMLYVALDAALRTAAPAYPLAPGVRDALHYFNLFGTMLILTFLAGCYDYLIHKAQAALRAMADTDPLTSLLNRRAMTDIVARQEAHVRRGRSLSFVLCDIDHFKRINDTRGHEAGDAVLKAVSEALRQSVREVDHLARWGGEEFLAVLPDTDHAGAEGVAQRLRQAVEAIAVAIGERIPVSITLGVATVQAGESADQAIARADAALYAGKRSGRNRVVMA